MNHVTDSAIHIIVMWLKKKKESAYLFCWKSQIC